MKLSSIRRVIENVVFSSISIYTYPFISTQHPHLGLLNGCASVFNTHLSKLIVSGSLKHK